MLPGATESAIYNSGTTVGAALKKRGDDNHRRVSEKQLLLCLLHRSNFSRNRERHWDSERQRQMLAKKAPTKLIFWFPWCLFNDENGYKILIASSKPCSWIYDCVWHCDCEIPQVHESLPGVQIPKA